MSLPRCEPPAPAYTRRRPEETLLHSTLRAHLETFLERAASDPDRPGLPSFVERELRRYLECGLLAHGFVRVHCPTCRRDALVAFSCKGRGFCPSCGGRRMAETAAHLVDHVLPDVPVRQWVLTVPYPLRFLLAYDPELTRLVRRTFLRAVFGLHVRRARDRGHPAGRTGAVNVIQRFGGALNLNVHFHALVLDGVYTAASAFVRPVFHALESPSDEEVEQLLATLRRRILRLLAKRGRLDDTGLAPTDVEERHPLLAHIAAASIRGRTALGSPTGSPVERFGTPVTGARPAPPPRERCAHLEGFSLDAQVAIPAGERDALEHLCRYVARGPVATERLSLDERGRILLRLARPWTDGTTHIAFSPIAFLERLAALVPRPRTHLVTYHGVLGPAASWRDEVIPPPPEDETASPEKPAPPLVPVPRPRRIDWAELLRRVFALDVLRCEHCGGHRRVLATVTAPAAVRAILEHLGLPASAPELAPSRAPPGLPFGNA